MFSAVLKEAVFQCTFHPFHRIKCTPLSAIPRVNSLSLSNTHTHTHTLSTHTHTQPKAYQHAVSLNQTTIPPLITSLTPKAYQQAECLNPNVGHDHTLHLHGQQLNHTVIVWWRWRGVYK